MRDEEEFHKKGHPVIYSILQCIPWCFGFLSDRNPATYLNLKHQQHEEKFFCPWQCFNFFIVPRKIQDITSSSRIAFFS